MYVGLEAFTSQGLACYKIQVGYALSFTLTLLLCYFHSKYFEDFSIKFQSINLNKHEIKPRIVEGQCMSSHF